jgi:RHS repeat-associated protein
LQFIPTSQGYVNATTIRGNYRFNYVYNYLDHLGNVRLSYGRDPQARNEIKILEENHYYPYGLKHTNYNANLNAYKKDINDQVQLTGTGLSADLINKYKFNGMEYQDELGLNLYDMDMRDYDPAIGRWLGIDPVTHFSQSTYNAFDSNPVSIADPSGADGVVYGMAGQSAWSNSNPRGYSTFGNGNYGNSMPNSFAEGIGSGWGNGGLLSIILDWDKMDLNTFITFSRNGINLSSDNVVDPIGVLLPMVTIKRGRTNNASTIQQHIYRNSPYHYMIRDYIQNTGQAYQNAGDSLASTGFGLTLTGYGAPLGVPLAGLGGAFSLMGGGLKVGVAFYNEGLRSYDAWKSIGFYTASEAAKFYISKALGAKGLYKDMMNQIIEMESMLLEKIHDYEHDKK